MKLELIHWADHYSPNGDSEWADIDETAKAEIEPMICQSVGWVITEDDKHIRLLANLNGSTEEASQGFGAFIILKAAIVKRKKLRA